MELSVELFGKAHRAGSECRSEGTSGDGTRSDGSHFHTRQNICAMREQRQRFSCRAYSKSTTYARSVGKADDRTENNGRLATLFLFVRQTKAVMKISLLDLIPLLFCVRTVSDKRMILVTFVETKVTLRSYHDLMFS